MGLDNGILMTNHMLFVLWLVMLIVPIHSLASSHLRLEAFSKFSTSTPSLRASVSSGNKSYAVVFDAGSTGSRVHVLCFDQNMDLVPLGSSMEFFSKTKPGLSANGKDPKAAAASLVPLLNGAKKIVPRELHSQTPVKLGATAGLRLLPNNESTDVLSAVQNLLEKDSGFMYKDGYVAILSGLQEGSYMWVALNYLSETLVNRYMGTYGIVDLGGGSVQMAYGVSKKAAENAPKVEGGEDQQYIKKLTLKGKTHHLYVHSYLNYGLLAARGEILKVKANSNPCILDGFAGSYTYGQATYPVSSSPSGASIEKCKKIVLKALKINEPCGTPNCTFGGVWNGGGGAGQKNMYVASFFYGKATQTGFVDPNEHMAKVLVADFRKEAERACKTKYADVKSVYPRVLDVEYVCMDLVYQYILLTDGFGFSPKKMITLVEKIPYKNYSVEAAWPLGSAVEVVSKLRNRRSLYSLF